MISIHIMGGLGNQLFQIFTALSYSIDNKMRLVFPYNTTSESCSFRKTYWNVDDFLDRLSNFTTLNKKHGINNDSLLSFSKYQENGFTYNKLPRFYTNTILIGYFQSYKYFEYNKECLFSLLKLSEKKKDIIIKYTEYFDISKSTENISMHFRLGDYKYLQEYHPILVFEYYKNALDLILCQNDTKLSNMTFQVLYFCEEEDNSYVESLIEKFKLLYSDNIIFIKVSDSIVDWEQMLIMSCCKYNIIANSTFSWWGAYFNTIEERKVYYPCKWFGDKLKHDMSDFFPNDWISIQNT